MFFTWGKAIPFSTVADKYHGSGFGNIWGYYKYKLRIIKIQFIFLFLTAVNITFYIPFNLSGSLSLSLSLSISHTRTRDHTNTHTHVNTSFFARRELISVTVTLAEKYYSTTNLHWNESCVTFKYNEQRLIFFLLIYTEYYRIFPRGHLCKTTRIFSIFHF